MFFLYFVVVTIVFVVLFYGFVVVYSQKVISFLVERKHRDAEMILNSGIAPPDWGKKGLARFGHSGLSKMIAMRKIRQIIHYFRHTPIVEDEESRELLVSRLQKIRESWKKMGWKEIYPYE